MISVMTLFNNITVPNGGTVLSVPIDLRNLGEHCKLSLDLQVLAGSGTITAVQNISDGTAYATFVKPSHADATLCTGHGKTTNTVGRDFYRFNSTPFIDSYMVIGLTAATADASNVSAKLIIWAQESL